MAGTFLEQFFQERGPFEPNSRNEAEVLCPFPHDRGFETRPSAHVNTERGVFNCKTCRAEGRFREGGLSEASFVSTYYNVSYEEALNMIRTTDSALFTTESWTAFPENLWKHEKLTDWLQGVRGLTKETIDEYKLGADGAHIVYPVFVNGVLLDRRSYNIDWKDEQDKGPSGTKVPKIKSEVGASELLFPFDQWKNDPRPTLLVAGENDALLGRQSGFNAVTSTGGEGSLPKVFLGLFKGKDVYVCYDCDEPGRKSSRRVAFLLRQAGANVRIIDLQLPGTKESKDLSDYLLRDGGSPFTLHKLMQDAPEYDGEMFAEDKNKAFPLVDIWNVYHGEWANQRLSSRVVMSGRYDTPMEVPTAVELNCNPNLESPICRICPYREKGHGWWMLEEHNLDTLLGMVEVSPKQQESAIRKALRFPAECPSGFPVSIRARKGVTKAIFTPDAETEDESSGFRDAEQHAYVLEKVVDGREDLTDGQRYRIYYKRYAHPLQDQQVVLVVDRAEASDNSMNMFKMTPQIQEQLTVFQGPPDQAMKDRADRMHDITKRFKPQPMIANMVDLMYHSPLRFKFGGAEMKGYPEMLVFGESRSGKTETPLLFLRYVQLGNFMPVKGATTAGLLGGADRMGNGSFRINWGSIPRNHKGLVILDEMSGMTQEVLASLTSMRSERVATVHKIAKGKAPAETRLLWTSNPRKVEGKSRHVRDYPNGVVAILDLVGADEDIARFDVCLMVEFTGDTSPLDLPEKKAHDPEVYRNLIYWAWTRKSDQIQFSEGVEAYVVQVAKELNEKYNTDVKFFGAEAWKKLARIAVACAGACFSCSADGECIVVGKPHVDWAASYLSRCYDNDLFRLAEYVKERRSVNETNESVNAAVAGLCRTQPILVKALISSVSSMPMPTLQAMAGLEQKDWRELINKLVAMNLIQIASQGAVATRRLRAAVDAHRGERMKERMVPLAEQ